MPGEFSCRINIRSPKQYQRKAPTDKYNEAVYTFPGLKNPVKYDNKESVQYSPKDESQ